MGDNAELTEREKAEAALRENEAFYRAAISALEEGLVFQDAGGAIRFSNSSAERILGLTAEQLAGRTSLDPRWRAIHEDGSPFPGETHPAMLALRTGQPQSNVMMGVHKPDGALTWISINARPLFHPGETQAYAVVTSFFDITARKHAEAALAQERDLLQALLDNLPDTLYFKDSASRFTRINRAQARLLGVADPAEAIGKTDADFQPAHLAREFLAEEQHLLATGQPVIDRVESNPAPDGQPRWFSATKAPLRDREGRIVGLVGVSRDITARKQAEESLRASEVKLRAIVDNSTDIIYIKDTQGRYLLINPAGAALFRLPEAAILGKTDADLFGPETAWAAEETDRRVIASRRPLTYERKRDFGGVTHTFLNTKVRYLSPQGEVLGLIGVAHDITERQQAEAALRESEARYRYLVDQATDIVYQTDAAGRITYCNPAATRLLKYSAAELIGQPYLKLVHPADRAATAQFYERQFLEKTPWTYSEIRALAQDGGEVWLGQNAQLMTEQNRVAGFYVVARDITERKLEEVALQEANEQLTRWLAELEERNLEIALLNEITRAAIEIPDFSAMLQMLADRMGELLSADGCYITLWDEVEQRTIPAAAYGTLRATYPALAPLPGEATMTASVLQAGKTLVAEDVFNTPYLSRRIAEQFPTRSMLGLPLIAGEVKLGAALIGLNQPHHFTPEEIALGEQAARQIALAVANSKLRETLRNESIRDPLTGLFNRRHMQASLGRELERAAHGQYPIGILMLDLDHFKRFNDTFGHAAGDVLLRDFAGLLQSHVRAGDVACRYGGEEFTLILPEASLEVTRQRAEQLRESAGQLHSQFQGQALGKVTVSLGVALYPRHGATGEEVLRAADQALYQAKRAGRNRVIVADAAPGGL